MSENYPSEEYESREMSDVMKFYYSLQGDSISEDQAVMSVCMLIESLPEDRQPPLSLLMEHDAMPAEWLYDVDQATVTEMLALLPLTYLSLIPEESDYPAERLKKWNNDVMLGLRMVTAADHGQRCLRHDPDCTYDQCQTSLICPRRAMKRFVTQSMSLPNFSSPSYKSNPKRAHEIATDKLAIGVEQMLVLPNKARNLRMTYEIRYQGWLHGLRSARSDTV